MGDPCVDGKILFATNSNRFSRVSREGASKIKNSSQTTSQMPQFYAFLLLLFFENETRYSHSNVCLRFERTSAIRPESFKSFRLPLRK